LSLGVAFVSTLVMASYTGSVASTLTVQASASAIQGIADLQVRGPLLPLLLLVLLPPWAVGPHIRFRPSGTLLCLASCFGMNRGHD
jgi:hypothetical protein